MAVKQGNEDLTGGCYCGLIRYRIRGGLNKVAFCHCESCRKITGAPVTVAVMASLEKLEFVNKQPRNFVSSTNARRSFCAKCGTPINWSGDWHGKEQMFVYAGTLDDISLIKPDRHAFAETCVPWLTVNPDLPSFEKSSSEGVLDPDC